MFIRLTSTPRDCAWGSTTALAEFRGRPTTGQPEAELWLGTHPGAPTQALDTEPAQLTSYPTLEEWIRNRPHLAHLRSGEPTRLPVLLKVLAAASPLSLQVHPSARQAEHGFTLEELSGIPAEDPRRNYKDPYPKPEIIVALSETFEALCGFRPTEEIGSLIQSMRQLASDRADLRGVRPLLDQLEGPQGIQGAVSWLLSGQDDIADCITQLTTWARSASVDDPGLSDSRATIRLLADHHPGDPGIAIALLMNRVTLRRGECLFADAGTLHAYLDGLGLELMTASDNVVRGSLTPKHIDRAELLKLLRFEQAPPAIVHARRSERTALYEPPAPFRLMVIEPESSAERYPLGGPAIVIAEADVVHIADGINSMALTAGEAAFISSDVVDITAVGRGRLWIATWNAAHDSP